LVHGLPCPPTNEERERLKRWARNLTLLEAVEAEWAKNHPKWPVLCLSRKCKNKLLLALGLRSEGELSECPALQEGEAELRRHNALAYKLIASELGCEVCLKRGVIRINPGEHPETQRLFEEHPHGQPPLATLAVHALWRVRERLVA